MLKCCSKGNGMHKLNGFQPSSKGLWSNVLISPDPELWQNELWPTLRWEFWRGESPQNTPGMSGWRQFIPARQKAFLREMVQGSVSQLCLHFRITLGTFFFFSILISKPYPIAAKSEFLKFEHRHQYFFFFRLPTWFACAATGWEPLIQKDR